MENTEALQRRLVEEMMASRTGEADPQPPRFVGKDAYYVRSAAGSQYEVLCRRLGGPSGREKVLFDLNAIASEGKKPSFGVWRISPDSTLLAVSVDFDGSESFTIFIRSLEGRREDVEHVTGAGRWLEWAADSRTLFYTSPYGRAPNRLIRRRIGSPGSPAQDVYLEPSYGAGLGLMKTATGQHIVLITYGSDWGIRVLPAHDASGTFRILAPRRKGVRYWLVEEGGAFYLMENEAGQASRIVRTPTATVQDPGWEEVLSLGPGLARLRLRCRRRAVAGRRSRGRLEPRPRARSRHRRGIPGPLPCVPRFGTSGLGIRTGPATGALGAVRPDELLLRVIRPPAHPVFVRPAHPSPARDVASPGARLPVRRLRVEARHGEEPGRHADPGNARVQEDQSPWMADGRYFSTGSASSAPPRTRHSRPSA